MPARRKDHEERDAPVPALIGVLYGRISKDRENETSSETQTDESTVFAGNRGITILDAYFDYGKSAFKANVKRPQLEAALQRIESGHANVLIVWKLDRLIRNARGFMKIHERLTAAGATFVSKTEPWFDTSTPMGLALVYLMATLAEMESQAIRERVLPVQGKRRAGGRTPGGVAPFGYERTQRDTLSLVPANAALVRDAAARILSGTSIRSIAREWTDTGVASHHWQHASVRALLASPTIAGKRKQLDGTFVEGAWEPIIDDATFAGLTNLFAGNRPSGNHGTDLRWYLTGLITCGRCGGTCRNKHIAPINGHPAGRRYSCGKCSSSIDASVIDPFMDDAVRHYLTDERWDAIRSQGRKADPAAMERMRSAMDHERNKWLDGVITDGEWDDAQRNINARLAAMESLATVTVPDVDSARDAWPTLTPANRRLIITATMESITIAPYAKGVTGTARIAITFRQ